MDPEGGAQSIERLKEAGNDNASMYIIQNAGHHGEFTHNSLVLALTLLHSLSGQS